MKTLIQASTLNALMLGNFDRTISIKDFLHHADTGIGTYTGLDGEAIFEDGVAYKATADGKVTVMKPENGVAFGTVMAVLMQFIAPSMVRPFTSDEAVVLAGASYIRGYIFDCLFAGIQFSFSGYFCAYGKSGLSFLHNSLSILLVRVPGAYLASRFFPQTLLPMGLASACGSLFSSVVCVIAYCWLKRQLNRTNEVLHG